MALLSSAKRELLGFLSLLTLVFFIIEISFALQRSGFYLGDYQYISAHLDIPYHLILPAVAFYFCAQLGLHSLFVFFIWGCSLSLRYLFRLSDTWLQRIGFILWTVTLILILVANQIHYPNSKFADLTRLLMPEFLAIYFFYFFMIIITIAAFFGFIGLIKFALLHLAKYLLCLVLAVIGFYGFLFFPFNALPTQDAGTLDKPNIIIIGIDSIRPDYLSYFGADNKTTHLDSFLNHASVFAEALTPLARTFPAWISILTGLPPTTTGMRFDLTDQKHLDTSTSIAKILQKNGYHTIYATDETRFSNIDKNLGFDQILTPPTGLNDFLLGTFNDFPLSNLVVNTWVGKWLFPYSYANRANFITYDPESFLKLVKPTLFKSRHQPVFLAIHFCLPHFPYFWAASTYTTTIDGRIHYERAVSRVDEQVGDFLTLLSKAQLLKHTMVVLLSDHGEALELPGDRITAPHLFIPGAANTQHTIPKFYPPSFDDETVDRSAGHGTDVLGLSQYHSLLAFRLFGLKASEARMVGGVVSLMDIKPTLLNYLHLSSSANSLLPTIVGPTLVLKNRDFLIESDFSPEAVRSVHPETRKVLFEGIDYFHIDPRTGRLTVKPTMADLIISSKQFADLYQHWMLALYPQPHGSMLPILVNLNNGKWTDDLSSSFAQDAPLNHMLSALNHQFGPDLKPIKNLPQH